MMQKHHIRLICLLCSTTHLSLLSEVVIGSIKRTIELRIKPKQPHRALNNNSTDLNTVLLQEKNGNAIMEASRTQCMWRFKWAQQCKQTLKFFGCQNIGKPNSLTVHKPRFRIGSQCSKRAFL